jgi:hypothetical protein
MTSMDLDLTDEQKTGSVSEHVRLGERSVASGRNRHVPPLELAPSSEDWLASYAGRRLFSQIDLLNCIDAGSKRPYG